MKSFNFTSGLWGLFTSPSAKVPSQIHIGSNNGLQLVSDFLMVVSEGQLEKAQSLLTPNFKAHEPALNTILTADELLYEWEVNRQLVAHQRFEIKKTATFSVFGDIDRDKYIYIKADYHTVANNEQLQKTVLFEMIARIEEDRIAHLLFSFGFNKAFDKLSSVQHARSLAHAC